MGSKQRIRDALALAVWAEARAVATGGRLAALDGVALAPGPLAQALGAGVPDPEAALVGALASEDVEPRAVFEARLGDGPGLALAGALLASAASADAASRHVHFWISETTRQWLDGWRPPQAALRRDVHDMLAMGINLRGRDIEAFLWAARQALEGRAVHAGFLGAVACLTWTASRLEPAFRAAAALGEHAPTASFLAGLFAGAWGGLSRDDDHETMNRAVRETAAFAYDVGVVGNRVLGGGEA